MNEAARALLMDAIANLGNRIHAVEVALIDYMETNPKGDSQWIEQRLRVLENEVKNFSKPLVATSGLAQCFDSNSLGELKWPEQTQPTFEHRISKLEQEAKLGREAHMVFKADITYMQTACKSYERQFKEMRERIENLVTAAQPFINLVANTVGSMEKPK